MLKTIFWFLQNNLFCGYLCEWVQHRGGVAWQNMHLVSWWPLLENQRYSFWDLHFFGGYSRIILTWLLGQLFCLVGYEKKRSNSPLKMRNADVHSIRLIKYTISGKTKKNVIPYTSPSSAKRILFSFRCAFHMLLMDIFSCCFWAINSILKRWKPTIKSNGTSK